MNTGFEGDGSRGWSESGDAPETTKPVKRRVTYGKSLRRPMTSEETGTGDSGSNANSSSSRDVTRTPSRVYSKSNPMYDAFDVPSSGDEARAQARAPRPTPQKLGVSSHHRKQHRSKNLSDDKKTLGNIDHSNVPRVLPLNQGDTQGSLTVKSSRSQQDTEMRNTPFRAKLNEQKSRPPDFEPKDAASHSRRGGLQIGRGSFSATISQRVEHRDNGPKSLSTQCNPKDSRDGLPYPDKRPGAAIISQSRPLDRNHATIDKASRSQISIRDAHRIQAKAISRNVNSRQEDDKTSDVSTRIEFGSNINALGGMHRDLERIKTSGSTEFASGHQRTMQRPEYPQEARESIHSSRNGGQADQEPTETPRKRKLKDRLRLADSTRKRNKFQQDSDLSQDNFSNSSDSHESPAVVSSDDETLVDYSNDRTSTIPISNLTTATPGKGRATYGQQRSHIMEQETTTDPLLEDTIIEAPESRTSNRRKLGFVESGASSDIHPRRESTSSEDLTQEKPLRSVHELKAAGKMRRAALETDALVEDIVTSSTTAVRRSSIFRLADRLLSEDFRESFVRNGQHVRFLQLGLLEQDEFFGAAFLIAVVALIGIAPASDLVPKASGSSLFDVLSRTLRQDVELVQLSKKRQANMSRIHQQDFKDLVTKYASQLSGARSDLGGNDIIEITNRRLGLRCLEIGVRRLRQSGFCYEILDIPTISKLSEIGAGISKYSSSLSRQSSDEAFALSILESLSVARVSNCDNGSDLPPQVIEHIVQILTSLLQQWRSDDQENLSLVLRTCLNITTNSPSNCRRLAKLVILEGTTKMIGKGYKEIGAKSKDSSQDAVIDNLILGLGFLTNLVEGVEGSRILFLDRQIGDLSCLDQLLDLFQEQYEGVSTATTETESKLNVVFGYLAVLLCYICLNSQARTVAVTKIRDPALSKIREAVAQFILFHRTIGMESSEEQGDSNIRQALFVNRMEKTLRSLTSVTR